MLNKSIYVNNMSVDFLCVQLDPSLAVVRTLKMLRDSKEEKRRVSRERKKKKKEAKEKEKKAQSEQAVKEAKTKGAEEKNEK